MNSVEDFDIIIIGAGLSGIAALTQIRQELPNYRVAVFEKGDHVGGTWAKNTYPGLSCDIPSQLYSYSFAPNPDWSEVYASQPEILAYIEGVVSRFDLPGRIHLEQECTAAEWLDHEFRWRISFIDRLSGRGYVKHARFLITAVGFCDVPNGAEDIQDVENFAGRIFHSANWDHAFDFRDKNVVVVGNGCSANQFVPHLLKHAAIRSMVQVMRSPHWIAPQDNHPSPAWQKWLFRSFPTTNRIWRFFLAAKLDLAFPAFTTSTLGTLLRKALQTHLTAYIPRTAPPAYHSILLPSFPFGAKRPVLDHGYLAAFHNPKMKLLRSPSLSVTGPGELQTEDGTTFPTDVLILANGFKTQELLTPMTITGLDGAELPAAWQLEGKVPEAYMGVCVPSFPNLFLLTGPNTLPSGHSTLSGIECSVTYILRLLRPLVQGPPAATTKGVEMATDRVKISVHPTAHHHFNERIQRRLQRLVYTADVRSWYVDWRSGRNTLVWPGTQGGFWWGRCVEGVRWGDFDVVRKA